MQLPYTSTFHGCPEQIQVRSPGDILVFQKVLRKRRVQRTTVGEFQPSIYHYPMRGTGVMK
jgi:hypothetical protein